MNEAAVVEKARELKGKNIQWRRVGAKQAWISNMLDGQYFLIKSYATIVGLVDMDENKYYEIGKYSPTTSRQMTQIHRSNFSNCEREFIDGEV